MKLLLSTPSIRPLGARRSLVELIKVLPPSITPILVCPSMDGIALEVKSLGVEVSVVPHGAWRKLGGRFTSLFWQIPGLRRTVEVFKPNIIHCNEFHSVPMMVQAIRGEFPICGHVRLSITPRQTKTYLMNGCTRIVTVSEAVAGLFNGSGLEDRVRVIYNGVDVSFLATEGSPLPAVAQLAPGGFVGNRLVVGLFGLISPRKNQLMVAEAVAKAVNRGADVAVLFAGDAFKTTMEYGEDLRRRLAAPDLQGRALWLPFQKDVAALYRSIDVNLLVSSEEGFGRTIIEAGAVGKPSVGSRIGGIPELIREGSTGWLIDNGDADALAAVLYEMWANRKLVTDYGEATRRLVEENFTIQAHAKKMASLWEEAIVNHRKPV